MSQERLRELVAETRARGFAVHRGLTHPGSWGIGVVVRDEFDQPTAALSIGTIEARLGEDRQETLAKLLHAEADRVHAKLLSPAPGKGAAEGRRHATKIPAPYP